MLRADQSGGALGWASISTVPFEQAAEEDAEAAAERRHGIPWDPEHPEETVRESERSYREWLMEYMSPTECPRLSW